MRFVVTLLLSALAICLSSSPLLAKAERPQSPAPEEIRAGGPAPDFTLKDLEGKTVTLSQYRGKVVFLNFWASWCPPCRAEMPSMDRLNEVYAGRDFVMLAVNVEKDAEAVRAFAREQGHHFTVLLDSEAQAQRLYGVNRFPETFLIDKQGRVVERYLGARDWSNTDFLRKINAMTKE